MSPPRRKARELFLAILDNYFVLSYIYGMRKMRDLCGIQRTRPHIGESQVKN